MPLPFGAAKVRVTCRDMMEDYEKEEIPGHQSVTIIILPVKWTRRLRGFLFGRYKDLYIYSVDRVE